MTSATYRVTGGSSVPNLKRADTTRFRGASRLFLGFLVVSFVHLPHASAQFSSGSTGADGALDLTGSPSVVEFDPVALGIDPEGDNIFNFTTINIPSGVTVHLSTQKMPNLPVYWLATGAVTIDGTVDLSGADGHPGGFDAVRVPSAPGPGGFAGGVAFGPPSGGCTLGSGPGSPNCCTNSASHVNAVSYACGNVDRVYGNLFLQPLVGGSGGSGASSASSSAGGGGAGGGALLIASPTSIAVEGQIDADGGNGVAGSSGVVSSGGGSGGSVRLVAPSVSGMGSVSVGGGQFPTNGARIGSVGRIRIEALNYTYTGEFTSGASVRVVRLTDSTIVTPMQAPSQVRVVSIGGVAAPLQPTGLFSPPDVTIDSADPVDVIVEATNIPLGTTLGIDVYNESLGVMSAQTTPLDGTLEASSATATIDIPPGFSGVTVQATWTP